jgi:hypothetical protein
MENRNKPIIDMTREGEFVDPPRQSGWPPQGAGLPPFGANLPLSAKIGRTAILVAVLAGLLCAAALALWFALALIPVVLAASAVAWVAYRIQIWRSRS